MSINETTIERLLTLARFDPVAYAASGLLDSGTPLEECLIAAAEVWSRRCRGLGGQRSAIMPPARRNSHAWPFRPSLRPLTSGGQAGVTNV
jgi:hypothetical protein